MKIIKPFRIENPETKIAEFIYELTGLRVSETDDELSFKLTLGVKDRTEVGFFKAKHPDKSVKNIKYSMYVAMLASVAQLMKSPNEFEYWVGVNVELSSLTSDN